MGLELKATLRIYSKGHTLAKLTQVLGEPTDGCSVGDSVSKSGENREYAYWSIESSPEFNGDLNSRLDEVLDFIDSKSSSLSALKKDCEIDLTCMLYSDDRQGGTMLSPEIITRLSQTGYELSLDFFADVE